MGFQTGPFNPDCAVVALQEEFTVQPSDVEVAEGEVAVLNCGPPTGHPEPNVIWKKDGLPINSTDRHYTVSPLLQHDCDGRDSFTCWTEEAPGVS